jgi:hypothetical protein
MKMRDLKGMRDVGEKKLSGEANLGDMSEVRVRELDDGSARYELDEKNLRFRRIEAQNVGPWETLDEK